MRSELFTALLLASAAALGTPEYLGHSVARAQDVPCAVPAPAPAPALDAHTRQLRGFATGTGVRVAVVDTGVSPTPELNHLFGGADFVTPDAPDPLRDCDGHGTVVAGVIAATTTGIAPNAEIVSVRQTSAHYRNREDGENSAHSGSVATLAAALNAALDEGVRVINISVVSCVDPRDAAVIDASELDSALARAEREGVLVVAAAGNVTESCPQGSYVYPAHSPTVLAVGARDTAHTLADYSVAPPEGRPLLSAPGLVETGLSWEGGGFAAGSVPQRDQVTPLAGTSFAAPVVSATAALLLERYPHLRPAELRALIIASAEPSGGAVDPRTAITFAATRTATEAAALATAQTHVETAPRHISPEQARLAPAQSRSMTAIAVIAALVAASTMLRAWLSRWLATRHRG